MWRMILLLGTLAVALFAGSREQTFAQGTILSLVPASKYTLPSTPSFEVDVWVRSVWTPICEPYSTTEPCGLGAYEIEIGFDPEVIQYQSTENGPLLTSTGRLIWMCFHASGHDPDNGVIVWSCTTTGNPPGQPEPFGPEGSGLLATITFAPRMEGTTPLQFQSTILGDAMGDAIEHSSEDGSVTVQDLGTGDSDGDGCADVEEAGDDPTLGGDRNPFDPYDFYDVPVPAREDPTPNGAKNQGITMGDVLAVLFYTGTYRTDVCGDNLNGNGVDYDCDKGVDTDGDTAADIPPDGVPDGQGYDRSPAWPSSFSGPPDNAISMGDVLAVLLQTGHSCVAPP